MDRPTKDFRACALASGLLTQAQLDEAALLVESPTLAGPANDAPSDAPLDDRGLADKLVELGRITRYQADQMLAGRSKLQLLQYRILESIGHGGMGEVFKAEHMIMGRIVAVKVLPRCKTTPEAIANFMHEIRAQARLHHENLVQAYDAGHDGQVYFLVTEYVPGTDLRRYVSERGPLSMRAAATIVSQAACGLAHAHSQSLIHRDVKPGNLLVTPTGQTKVSDLGLAGWLDGTEHDPRAGRVVGTADYLSPEQILSPHEVTPASDIYSLGCTLYYSVTGKVPFPGGATRDKAMRHLDDAPLHPRLLNPELSDEFIDAMADMMEKNPTKRIQTANDVVRRLAPWAGARVDAPLADPERPSMWRQGAAPPPALPELTSSGSEEFATLPEPEWQTESGSHSHSQISQATEPIGSALDETDPLLQGDLYLAPRRTKLTREQWILGSVAGFAILMLLISLISLLLK